jgi:hypothetical protein
MRFLANHIPLFHHEARVVGEREAPVAEHRIVLREAENRRLQIRGKGNSLKTMRGLVEGMEEFGGGLCQGRIVFYDQKFHDSPACWHRAQGGQKIDTRA